MAVTVRWSDWEGRGLEHCSLRAGRDGLCIQGVVVGTRESLYGGHYRVVTDAAFNTIESIVEYTDGPRLHIQSDGQGRWRDVSRNQSLSMLDGCHDVDIGMTPATNTLPIKRLNLQQGEQRTIAVAYIPLLIQIEGTFIPRRVDQRYTCITPDQLYLYEGLFRGFSAELEVDKNGLVKDYPHTFRRHS